MALLDANTKQQVTKALALLEKEVELVIYKDGKLIIPGREVHGNQDDTLALLREVADLSDKVTLIEWSLIGDEEAAAQGITLAPTIVFRETGSTRSNVRFIGFPGGYEFQTLIETLRMLGSSQTSLSETSQEKLAAVSAPVTIRSFVTPTCPYCPRAVLTAFALALHNPTIIAEGIEANEFPSLAQRYRISGVPDTIMHGVTQQRVLGAQPETVFVEALLKAVDGQAAPEIHG